MLLIMCFLQVLANGQVGPVLLRSVSQVTHAAEDACEVVLRSARQNRLVASLNYSSIEKQLSVQRDALQAVLTQVRPCAGYGPCLSGYRKACIHAHDSLITKSLLSNRCLQADVFESPDYH